MEWTMLIAEPSPLPQYAVIGSKTTNRTGRSSLRAGRRLKMSY
jgi:hypothetical protein